MVDAVLLVAPLYYLVEAEELHIEVVDAGFTETEVLAVTGFFAIPRIFENLPDRRSKNGLLTFLYEVERDPAMVGISGKLMATARRPVDSGTATTTIEH